MSARLPRIGLNLVADEAFREAAAPLFEEGLVDAIEWDIDEPWGYGWGERRMPRWIRSLLDLYSKDDALYGHGVWFSVLSARWEARHDLWLAKLARECARRRYRHVSEHFGWITAGRFAQGVMLPSPYTPAAVAVGRDRLGRIAQSSGGAVGLENLSIALCEADATDQGAFLDDLLAPHDGFLLLDLHNVYTQAVNLGLSPSALLERYPLHRVREIHVSGGSWHTPRADAHRGPVRLDSHDGEVPADVVSLLPLALERCTSLELIVYERRGDTLATRGDVESYRADFRSFRSRVEVLRGG